jgi:sterol desaturase/sphingolipid hydroxylase (fatty acid hydroxylase superfamily)
MEESLRSLTVDVVRLCVWLAALTLVFVPLERLFAIRPKRIFREQILTDLAYYFLSSLLPNFLLILPTALLAWCLHRLMPGQYLSMVAQLPLWVRISAVLVVGEIGFYWGHRWSHEIPLLWRFHAIHHSPEHVDWLVNTRAHPIDMVFTRLCGLVPIYVLGLSQTTGGRTDLISMLTILLATAWGFFIHANVRWRFGWLEWLVATPAFHHWHHTNDEHRDRNYAATLPWLDHLFGTFYLPKSWPPEYGIDATLPPGLVRQLLRPLSGDLIAPEIATLRQPNREAAAE